MCPRRLARGFPVLLLVKLSICRFLHQLGKLSARLFAVGVSATSSSFHLITFRSTKVAHHPLNLCVRGGLLLIYKVLAKEYCRSSLNDPLILHLATMSRQWQCCKSLDRTGGNIPQRQQRLGVTWDRPRDEIRSTSISFNHFQVPWHSRRHPDPGE